MFGNNYKRLNKEHVAMHQGVFHKEIGLFEGVALIVAGTIGAGVLGVPYAVAQVGSLIGLFYLVFLGVIMMGFNLLIGEIAVRTQGDFQMVGLAKKYLGNWGKFIMTILVYLIMFGILNVYIIGEGQSLSQLFGGDPNTWGVIFWGVGTFLVYVGLRIVKVVDFFLSLLILSVIVIVSLISVPHVDVVNFNYHNFASMLLPFGVILFAYSGGGAVLESYSLLKNNKEKFKKAILISGSISMVAYILFTMTVLGVTGSSTTEIATIGLGEKIGSYLFWFGNIFAALAMGMGFISHALMFRHSLSWDYKLSRPLATLIACGVPLVLFVVGFRKFTMMIDIVGGIFLTTESLLLILIYWKAKQAGDLPVGKYKLHHVVLLSSILALALIIGGVYSVVKLF